VSKKTDKLIKPRKQKKLKKPNLKKNWINWLKNHKKIPVRFGFGFQSLKLIEPSQTEPVQPDQHLKKTTTNRMFFLTLNLKLKLCFLHSLNAKAVVPLFSASPPSLSLSLCISPLPFSSHLSLLIGEGDWVSATELDRSPLRASLVFFLCGCVVVAPKRSGGKIE